jgi:hypothetical protein
MASFEIVRKINLPLEKAWSVLADFTNSPAPGIKLGIEKLGEPGRDMVGTVRTVTVGKDSVRQVIESVKPFHSYTYQMVDHPLMNGYHAHCELTGENDSTMIHYKAEISPAIPLTGGLICFKAKAGVNKFLDLIEQHHCIK